MICYTFTLDFSREIFLLCFDKIKDIILMNSTFAKKTKQKKNNDIRKLSNPNYYQY